MNNVIELIKQDYKKRLEKKLGTDVSDVLLETIVEEFFSMFSDFTKDGCESGTSWPLTYMLFNSCKHNLPQEKVDQFFSEVQLNYSYLIHAYDTLKNNTTEKMKVAIIPHKLTQEAIIPFIDSLMDDKLKEELMKEPSPIKN
jgi:hypothetical protein